MISRHAFTKVLKGQTMVRKLMLWKTNKEVEDQDFPAYVAYFIDFSPNRKRRWSETSASPARASRSSSCWRR